MTIDRCFKIFLLAAARAVFTGESVDGTMVTNRELFLVALDAALAERIQKFGRDRVPEMFALDGDQATFASLSVRVGDRRAGLVRVHLVRANRYGVAVREELQTDADRAAIAESGAPWVLVSIQATPDRRRVEVTRELPPLVAVHA